VIPARDEEANLATCLASICRQRYSRLEIIVIDDRSTDRTGQIARELAGRDSRIRVLSNQHLPPGWTGKTHVLHVAAQQARGGWFWFLDADTSHAPEFLGVMMEYARAENAAMVSLLPELQCETFWEQLVQPLGAIVLMQAFPLHRVNDDKCQLAFANGQSILIERGAYDAAGGHAAVRDRFVEDIAMAFKVKALNRPIRTVLVRDLVTCRMYASLGGLIRGWSRILYDALDRKPWRLVGRLLDPLIFCQSGHIALFAAVVMLLAGASGPFTWWLLGLSLVHHALMYPVFRLVYQASVPGSRYVAWFPVANLLIDFILLRAILMSLTGRVTWRGTSYGAKTRLARMAQHAERAGVTQE
jgi:glycosyltransferase involved in cell wall biosynthesis